MKSIRCYHHSSSKGDHHWSSDLPINDYLRDDTTLLKVTSSNPWYANLVNLMVTGYIPLGEDKKKLIHLSRFHLWDDPIYSKSMLIVYFAVASRYAIPMLKFGKVDFSVQTYMRS